MSTSRKTYKFLWLSFVLCGTTLSLMNYLVGYYVVDLLWKVDGSWTPMDHIVTYSAIAAILTFVAFAAFGRRYGKLHFAAWACASASAAQGALLPMRLSVHSGEGSGAIAGLVLTVIYGIALGLYVYRVYRSECD